VLALLPPSKSVLLMSLPCTFTPTRLFHPPTAGGRQVAGGVGARGGGLQPGEGGGGL